MARHRIPDFFDEQSRRLTESILSGQTPLVNVNRPGVSPNVLQFFQDPKNRALIRRQPLAGGLDPVASDGLGPAGSSARIALADKNLTATATRLRRSGLTRETADKRAEQLQQRRLERDQRAAALDERRRAAGLPTSEDRTDQRQEAFRRIRERKGIFREDVNRRRRAQGRKPFGPVVREEPILIQSPDDVDQKVHGSGQDFDTPDGDMFRLVINSSGDQTLVPTRVDPRTGQRIIDSREIEIDEFKDALTDTEREVRRRLIADSGTLFSRDLRAIQNNIAAIRASRQAGTTDQQTAEEQIENLHDDEAELMFEFDTTIGFSTAFEAESEAEIKQQEAQAELQADEEKQREARFKEERSVNSTLLKDAIKFLQDQAKIVAQASEERGAPKPVTEDQIQEEFQRRKRLLQSTTPRDITDTAASGEFQTSAGLFLQVMAGLGATPEEIAQRDVGRGAMPQETLPNGEAGFYSPLHARVVSSKEILETAKKRGMTVEEVMRRLRIIPRG